MPDWVSQMIETLIVLLILAVAVLWFRLNANAGIAHVVHPNSAASKIAQHMPIPWNDRLLPPDATHIAWIMLGDAPHGRIHALHLQTLESFYADSAKANSPIGPMIVRSIELESEILALDATAASEIMYAIARVADDGLEQWLGRDGAWVSRWSNDADVMNIFGDSKRLT